MDSMKLYSFQRKVIKQNFRSLSYQKTDPSYSSGCYDIIWEDGTQVLLKDFLQIIRFDSNHQKLDYG